MQESFEKFITWYIPVTLVSFLVASLSFLIEDTSGMAWVLSTFQMTLSDLALFTTVIKLTAFSISHIIAAVWLAFQTHTSRRSRVLWSLFRLTTALWAVGFWILMHILRKPTL